MTQTIEVDAVRTQRLYARLAGFLFLWLIITGIAGMLLTSRIEGHGNFTQIAQRVAASEHQYRLALTTELIETLSALLLGFALYVTLRPVNKLLAQLAMFWRVAESFVGCVGMVVAFAQVRLYTSAPAEGMPSGQAEALVNMTRYLGAGTFNIAALCFSLGSIIFFYLFYKSRYIPRILSAFGVFASVIVPIICFGGLIFPEYSSTLQYGWAPMAIAEVTTGCWLMFGARISADRQQGNAASVMAGRN